VLQTNGDAAAMLNRDEIQQTVAAANDDMETNLSRMTDLTFLSSPYYPLA